MRRGWLAAGAVICALGGSAWAQAPAASVAPIDYAQDAAWLCRPGRSDACSTAQLDAVAVDAQGRRTPQPFHAAADAKLDCFYVYPTVSRDQTTYSDMTAKPEEVRTVQSQFARFGSVCRTFAPLYRQLTLYGLNQAMQGGAAEHVALWEPAYQDVRAAFRDYLARDNRGRGFVLIGHSQGTILLQRLIAEEIDGKPIQKRFVSAFLAGDPGLSIPPGGVVGGTFKTIPLCRSRGETGCAYAWGSYAADDSAAPRRFGRGAPGMQGACVDPAAPGGGEAPLKAYLPRPASAPASDPPWVEAIGGFAAACRTDEQGSVLRVSVSDAPYAEMRQRLLAAVQRTPGWGLHTLDVNLVQGDMLDDVAAESRNWPAARR